MQSDHRHNDLNPTSIEGDPRYDQRSARPSPIVPTTLNNALVNYFRKMSGTATSPPRVHLSEMLWGWVGGFFGISAVAFTHFSFFEETDLILIIGSFGASAVLIYGAIESPLAQPRNFIGGHIVSAIAGVTAYKMLHPHISLAAAMAVALAIVGMLATRTVHPPGGATALIAVIGGEKIHALGYLYVIMPTGAGVMIMLVVALLVNNISHKRKYPTFWY